MKTHLRTSTTILLLCAASAACTASAPAPANGLATQAAVPTAVQTAAPVPTVVPTAAPAAAATPGSTDAQAQGPVTWDVRLAPGDVSDVVSTGALLVAVGSAGTSPETGDRAGVWTSSNGQTWEPASLLQPAGTMAAVAGEPGRLVAVGTVFEGTSGPAAWTSVDGRVWEALPASAFAASAGYEPGPLSDIVTGPGGFVVVGSEWGAGGSRAAAWYSEDGLTWTPTKSDLAGDSAGAVVRQGTGYIAAGWAPGEDGDAWAVFWSSRDGRSWTAAPDAADLHDVGSSPRLAASPQHVVAVGYPSHQWAVTDPLVWTSQDAVTWVRQVEPGLVAPLPAIPDPSSGQPVAGGLGVGGLIAVDGGFVASGGAYLIGPGAASAVPRRVVWTSPTGAAWSLVAELPALPAAPDSDAALVGTLVEHQGRLLVFGRPSGGSAPLWETELQGLMNSGPIIIGDAAPTAIP